MPGYTKEQLVAMSADRKQFKWCNKGCKKYWRKRGFASHARACRPRVILEITMPRRPKPKKGDVMIIHPAWENFCKWFVKACIQHLREDHADATQHEGPQEISEEWPKREYETITVDEAMVRYGMTREEIMAKFDAMRETAVVKRIRL